ncbi:hypothetical protein ACQPZP_36785 [Spirillospora sp. CA-142024]|uniref:hypothetical protein n=1 Tax=Spirillospora sp. CA-142024 TaxID=3240036 RepID=UPI003D907035
MPRNEERFDQPHVDPDANAAVLKNAADNSPTRQVDVQSGSNGAGNHHTITTVNAGQSKNEIKAQVQEARDNQ